MNRVLSRREFLVTGGALVMSFSLLPRLAFAQEAAQDAASGKPKLPGDLPKSPLLDAWIRIGADGAVTVFTGKAELGQGIKTALMQIAAEQLGVGMQTIALITADTERTPDEGYTAGSHSMQDSGVAILNAAAQVREILIGEAARRFGLAPERLRAENGQVKSDDGRSVAYGALVGDQVLHVEAQPQSKLQPLDARVVMGQSVARVDIPGKVSGGASYVQDLRLPGMLHARVMRPPSYGAKLKSLPGSQGMPGVVRVVRDGNFAAVVAEREWQAVRAARALSDGAVWEQPEKLPAQDTIYATLQALRADDYVIYGEHAPPVPAVGAIEASYRRPYQIHGSIGPSCAVALMQDGKLTVWTHSQGVYPLRGAIAEMVGMAKQQVHCIHLEGSGCYGHNAADDAAGDAALVARALPGRPVRVQWMREDEHAHEPFGPAMLTKVRATLDGGRISGWQFEVWSNTHSTRPEKAGNLAAALLLAKPFTVPTPKPAPQPEGAGDRNAIPLYALPDARVVHHFIPEMPLRVSAMRGLGAYANIFSIESFMDELALAANADPVAFRLRHLDDARGREVLQSAAGRFGWDAWRPQPGRGRGFAFARYKNLAAYFALAIEVEVEHETGEVKVGRVTAVVDSGEAVNPDGIRNQIEGGILQSLSWTLFENVTWDESRVTSRDWGRYPIMRFAHVPVSLDVHIIDRPGEPFLGTGEAAQGPTSAALANAVADATGVRIREIPLDRNRVKAAIGA